MTRRTLWLALIVAASQVSAGCCCWRQHCAGWRIRHWHGGGGAACCSPAYSSPVAGGPVAGGPGCSSCAGGPADAGVVAYGGPVPPPVVVGPGGPIPLHAPSPVVTPPMPLGTGPGVEKDGTPFPMPSVKPSN